MPLFRIENSAMCQGTSSAVEKTEVRSTAGGAQFHHSRGG
jgi:hypothetical protein